MTTDVLLVRHAATDWNEERRLQGRADRPLSAAGRRALENWRLPASFADARLLSSPLVRARDTARRFGEPRIEPRLIEMDWGAWEGLKLADLRRADPSGMRANEARGLDFRPPGGESPREVRDRLGELLVGLDGSGPAVLVTHKGVMRAVLSLATSWDFTDRPIHRVIDGIAWQLTIVDGAPSNAPREVALTAEGRACGS